VRLYIPPLFRKGPALGPRLDSASSCGPSQLIGFFCFVFIFFFCVAPSRAKLFLAPVTRQLSFITDAVHSSVTFPTYNFPFHWPIQTSRDVASRPPPDPPLDQCNIIPHTGPALIDTHG